MSRAVRKFSIAFFLLPLAACAFQGTRMEQAKLIGGQVTRGDAPAARQEFERYAKLKKRPFTQFFSGKTKKQEVAAVDGALQNWQNASNDCDRAAALSNLAARTEAIPDFQSAQADLLAYRDQERKKLDAKLAAGVMDVERLSRESKHVEAEKKLLSFMDQCPGNPQYIDMLGKVAERARLQRSAHSEALYAQKRVAAAYIVSEFDPAMTSEDRRWSMDAHAQEIAALKEALELTVVLEPAQGPAGDLRAQLEGTEKGVALAAAKPLVQRPYVFSLKVREPKISFVDPALARTEAASSHYVSGTQIVPNPDKARCEQQVMSLQQAMNQAQMALSQAQMTYNSCQAQAQETARQCQNAAQQAGGGFGGILLAGVGCGLVGGGLCQGPYNTAQAAAQQAQTDYYTAVNQCNQTPQQIQQNTYADQPYTVEYWSASAQAGVALELREGTPSGPLLWSGEFVHKVAAEDKVVHGQPQYSIQEDGLLLPGHEPLQAQLLQELSPKVRAEAAARALTIWRPVLERASRMGDEKAKRDKLAEILLLREIYSPTDAELDRQAEKLKTYLLTDERK